jgi:hypothetical protein
MSFLINDELIWVSIPKNASHSIEHSLVNTQFNITRPNYFYTLIESNKLYNINKLPHLHIKMKSLIKEFGLKETFCIKREFSERFISSIEFLWAKIVDTNLHTPIIPIYEITNDFLYEFFNTELINNLYLTNYSKNQIWFDTYSKLVKDEIYFETSNISTYESICTLLSQNFWLDGEKCTYEFYTDNLNEYKNFIKNKFNIEVSIPIINANPNKQKTKIINNNEFKNWVYFNFEKRFDKTNMSII